MHDYARLVARLARLPVGDYHRIVIANSRVILLANRRILVLDASRDLITWVWYRLHVMHWSGKSLSEDKSDGFKWVSFWMVGTIATAIGVTHHSKTETLEMWTSKCLIYEYLVFKPPICLVFQCLVFKPPLYSSIFHREKLHLPSKP